MPITSWEICFFSKTCLPLPWQPNTQGSIASRAKRKFPLLGVHSFWNAGWGDSENPRQFRLVVSFVQFIQISSLEIETWCFQNLSNKLRLCLCFSMNNPTQKFVVSYWNLPLLWDSQKIPHASAASIKSRWFFQMDDEWYNASFERIVTNIILQFFCSWPNACGLWCFGIL